MHPADVQSSSELYHLSEFGAMVVGRTTSERLAVDHRSPPLALALVLYRRGRQCSECSCSKMSPQQLPQVVGCCEESCGTLIMARLTKRSRSRCRKPSQKKAFVGTRCSTGASRIALEQRYAHSKPWPPFLMLFRYFLISFFSTLILCRHFR